jgi:hypothetical protein
MLWLESLDALLHGASAEEAITPDSAFVNQGVSR